MRNGLYAKLQEPAGGVPRPLAERAAARRARCSDLSLIRRWLAFGIVLLVVNVDHDPGRLRAPAQLATGCSGSIFLVCSIPLWIYGYVFESKYSIVARRSQDQAGDLATAVEESRARHPRAQGVRARQARARRSSRRRPRRCAAPRSRRRRRSPASGCGCCWCPDVAFALCLLGGVWLASHRAADRRRAGRVLRDGDGAALPDRVDRLPAVDDLRHPHARPTASSRCSTRRTRSSIPEPRRRSREPRGRLAFEDVHFRYQDSPERYPDLLDGIDLVLRARGDHGAGRPDRVRARRR